MPFVLDTSVAVAWQFGDENSTSAQRILDRLNGDTAHVPHIWPLEVGNALLMAQRNGRLTADKVSRAADFFLDLPITIHGVDAQHDLTAVLDLAANHRLTSYDASYLDLAMREGFPLATQDQRLIAAAEAVGVALVE